MCISPKSEGKGLQILPYLKYYNGMKWENTFTLALNAAKKIPIISNTVSNKNCSELNFLLKTHLGTCVYLSPGVDVGGSKCYNFIRKSIW